MSTELTSSALLLSINFTIPTPLFVAKDFFERRRCERSFGVFTFSYNAVKGDRQLPFLGPRGPHVESSISPVPSVRNNFSLVHR